MARRLNTLLRQRITSRRRFDQTTFCIVQARVEKAPGYGVLGRYTACSTERIEVPSKQDQTQSSSTIHSQLTVSRKVVVMESAEIIYQKVYVSTRPPPKMSNKDNGMCDLDSDKYQGRGDPYVDKSPHRKSGNVLCLITMMSQTQQVRGDPVLVDQKKTGARN